MCFEIRLSHSQAALIHLGAKFSPCMRSDTNVNNALALDRREENKTACCIFNDGSGCLQSSRGKCPASVFSLWFHWSCSGKSLNLPVLLRATRPNVQSELKELQPVPI